MRGLTCIVATMVFSLAARADSGVPPRGSAKDYPVQGQADSSTIAAAIVPANQVSKMFSPDISKHYVVVEVAVYPEGNVPVNVQAADFALRVGQRVGRADHPMDIVPWAERREAATRSPVDVTAEAGVIYERSDDPVYGRRQSVGTYTGVGVEEPGRANLPPPPDPRIDPRVVYDEVRRFALAEGAAKAPIAGYLYFPQYSKRKKSDEIELKYAKDDVAVNMILGKP